MVCAQLHSDVDIFSGCQTFGQNECAFVDQGNQDTVYDETSGFLDDDGSLAQFLGNLNDLVDHFPVSYTHLG